MINWGKKKDSRLIDNVNSCWLRPSVKSTYAHTVYMHTHAHCPCMRVCVLRVCSSTLVEPAGHQWLLRLC